MPKSKRSEAGALITDLEKLLYQFPPFLPSDHYEKGWNAGIRRAMEVIRNAKTETK